MAIAFAIAIVMAMAMSVAIAIAVILIILILILITLIRYENASKALEKNVESQEYNLLLNNDVHTDGHIQWYYFSVGNTCRNMKVRRKDGRTEGRKEGRRRKGGRAEGRKEGRTEGRKKFNLHSFLLY